MLAIIALQPTSLISKISCQAPATSLILSSSKVKKRLSIRRRLTQGNNRKCAVINLALSRKTIRSTASIKGFQRNYQELKPESKLFYTQRKTAYLRKQETACRCRGSTHWLNQAKAIQISPQSPTQPALQALIFYPNRRV